MSVLKEMTFGSVTVKVQSSGTISIYGLNGHGPSLPTNFKPSAFKDLAQNADLIAWVIGFIESNQAELDKASAAYKAEKKVRKLQEAVESKRAQLVAELEKLNKAA